MISVIILPTLHTGHQRPELLCHNNSTSALPYELFDMHFLQLPVEIRLRIYSEILVRDSPIEFGAYGPRNLRLNRVGRQGLNPPILRVCKMVNSEAVACLYSDNRFQFPDSYPNWNSYDSSSSAVPYMVSFLQSIGANTDLLRHISIDFPATFASETWGDPALTVTYVQLLQLIRKTCTGLRIMEIVCKQPDNILPLDDIDRAAKMLKALDDEGFKDMPSLEKVIVIYEEKDIDDEVMAHCKDLLLGVPSSKWSIGLTKATQRMWVSDQDEVLLEHYENVVFMTSGYKPNRSIGWSS